MDWTEARGQTQARWIPKFQRGENRSGAPNVAELSTWEWNYRFAKLQNTRRPWPRPSTFHFILNDSGGENAEKTTPFLFLFFLNASGFFGLSRLFTELFAPHPSTPPSTSFRSAADLRFQDGGVRYLLVPGSFSVRVRAQPPRPLEARKNGNWESGLSSVAGLGGAALAVWRAHNIRLHSRSQPNVNFIL